MVRNLRSLAFAKMEIKTAKLMQVKKTLDKEPKEPKRYTNGNSSDEVNTDVTIN